MAGLLSKRYLALLKEQISMLDVWMRKSGDRGENQSPMRRKYPELALLKAGSILLQQFGESIRARLMCWYSMASGDTIRNAVLVLRARLSQHYNQGRTPNIHVAGIKLMKCICNRMQCEHSLVRITLTLWQLGLYWRASRCGLTPSGSARRH